MLVLIDHFTYFHQQLNQTVQHNNYECTIDQELAGAASYAMADILFLLARQQHFSAQNDVMAAILKVWRQIKNQTPSIDV